MRPPIQRAQVMDDLRALIERGAENYRPGDTIPKHKKLGEIYNVSERTAGNAVRALVAEGLLESDGRAGTRVVGPPSRMFLVADAGLKNLRLIAGREEAEHAAEAAGGVVAELRVTKDYRSR